MGAELLHSHTQLIYQAPLLAPIAIGSVEHGRISDHGDSQKLAIRAIQRVLRQLVEASTVVLGRCDTESTHTFLRMLPLMDVFDKPVSNSRLTSQPQVLTVLLENQSGIVDGNDTVLSDLLKPLHASQLAIQVGMRPTAIGGHSHISIDSE